MVLLTTFTVFFTTFMGTPVEASLPVGLAWPGWPCWFGSRDLRWVGWFQYVGHFRLTFLLPTLNPHSRLNIHNKVKISSASGYC